MALRQTFFDRTKKILENLDSSKKNSIDSDQHDFWASTWVQSEIAYLRDAQMIWNHSHTKKGMLCIVLNDGDAESVGTTDVLTPVFKIQIHFLRF